MKTKTEIKNRVADLRNKLADADKRFKEDRYSIERITEKFRLELQLEQLLWVLDK